LWTSRDVTHVAVAMKVERDCIATLLLQVDNTAGDGGKSRLEVARPALSLTVAIDAQILNSSGGWSVSIVCGLFDGYKR
jgi:hypothetical protein